eukprot:GHVQ01013607.1.p1 GENE.GHVQ01013607.1~~GHVQ01013607.1.p1  ORF type:complete len:625 (+),score=97.46 GHVQ01013607.1:430-2304(+)
MEVLENPFHQDDGEPDNHLVINKKFARKYEATQRKQDLARGKFMLEDTTDSDDSETEDEDAALLTSEVDKKISSTLCRIRQKDPSVYNQTENIFSDADFDDDDNPATRNNSATKAVTYKDHVREILTRDGPEAFAEEEDTLNMKRSKPAGLIPYAKEQDLLRRDFLKAAICDGEDNLFLQKTKDTEEAKADEQSYNEFLKNNRDGAQDLANKFWATNEDLDSDEKFLRDFLVNEMWRDKDRPSCGLAADADEVVDETHVEQTDRFEAKYNFRFEEEGGTKIQSFPRAVDGSLRATSTARKRARDRRKDDLQETNKRRKEELNRLRNLKKQEILERLSKIQLVSGVSPCGMQNIDLDADFDPDQHDKQMNHVFDQTFEDQEEELDEHELSKTPAAIEEIVGENSAASSKSRKQLKREKRREPKNGIVQIDEGEAYAPIAPAASPHSEGHDPQDANGDQGESSNFTQEEDHDWWVCDACEQGIAVGQIRYDCKVCPNYCLCKRCHRIVKHPHGMMREKVPEGCEPSVDKCSSSDHLKKATSEYMKEYFDVDFEDIVGGDLPIRFKYTSVEAKDYGMTTEDILDKPDSELNSRVSLKCLAPYMDKGDDKKRKKSKKWLQAKPPQNRR